MMRRLISGLLTIGFIFTLTTWANDYRKCSTDSDCKGGESCQYGYCVQR
jgi:hypothetical protein